MFKFFTPYLTSLKVAAATAMLTLVVGLVILYRSERLASDKLKSNLAMTQANLKIAEAAAAENVKQLRAVEADRDRQLQAVKDDFDEYRQMQADIAISDAAIDADPASDAPMAPVLKSWRPRS